MRSLLLFGSVSMLCIAVAVPVQAAEVEDFYWRTSKDAIVHWAEGEVRMPVDPALVSFYGEGFKEALELAAAEWSVRSDIPVLVLDYEPTEADRTAAMQKRGNWIGLAHSWEYDDELAITVSTSDANTGSVLAAQVWLNARRPLAVLTDELVARGDYYDLQGVMTHEFGHVLGLGEGPAHTLATMNPNFKRGETHQRTVDVIDEDAVTGLYDHVEVASVPAAYSCSLGAMGAQGRSGSAWASLFALAALGRVAARKLHRRAFAA